MTVYLLVVWLSGMPMVMDAYTELDKCEAAATVQRAKPGRQAVCPVIRVVGYVEAE
jgi:hypothetical protein